MCYTNRAIYNDEENSGNGSFSAARRALQNTGGSNMSTKIIASDYDGTLCRDEGITEHDKAAIARWQTAGNLFGLVTGRNIHDALAVTRDPSCGIRFDFVICCSGSIVLDRDGHIIYDGAGEIPCLDRLADDFLSYDPMWLGLCRGEKRYALPVGQDSEHSEGETAPDGRLFLPREEFDKLRSFNVIQSAYPTVELAAEVTRTLEQRYGEWIHICANSFYLDTVPRGGGKSTGIRALADKLGIAEDDIISAGDNLNDIDMLTDFRSFAISTGHANAKAAADFTVDDIAAIVDAEI
ncbi:MAG: hypothetical protein DBX45_02170 [Oscillospiraceae bacterium]|jgi:cof family hydrolase|nr:MAG: hypothetical protein DBX45_02170 [Oscillospiraceae bacterium]